MDFPYFSDIFVLIVVTIIVNSYASTKIGTRIATRIGMDEDRDNDRDKDGDGLSGEGFQPVGFWEKTTSTHNPKPSTPTHFPASA